jgi:putative flippase GtrA
MHIRLKVKSGIRRWIVFNAVGAMGIVVQMSVLFILTSYARVGYLVATAVAVEAAILHNFFWHAHWTWADRTQAPGFFLRRFLGFHLANGALSIAGNLVLMKLFVGILGLNFMFANALAIALCSVLNFFAGDRLVFRKPGNNQAEGGIDMENKSHPILKQISFLITVTILVASFQTTVQAADLQPETIQAWRANVERIERRMSSELSSDRGFLALDFQDAHTSADERRKVLSGEIPIRPVTGEDDTQKVQVPHGMIHHWRGLIFIPGVTLDTVLARVANPRLEDARQEDVLDSRVIESRPGELKLYLKLQRSKIVTVVYNTEHMVQYRRYGEARAYSSSVATKIAEVQKISDGPEREKPEGRDHGFLWRMNSYWRYQEVKGGVIVECESMTLSRSIPTILEFIVRPLIKSVARESMRRTLESLRTRMTLQSLRADNGADSHS